MDGEFEITIPAHRTLTIPAGEATVLFVVAASAGFSVKFKGGKKTAINTGGKLGGPGGKPFNTTIFYNTTASPITATIYLSTRDYDSQDVTVVSTTNTQLDLVSAVPAATVKLITQNDTVQQLAAGSLVYVSEIRFYPGKSISAGLPTANTSGDVYVGASSTFTPNKRATTDVDYPVVFTAPPGQKIPLTSFYIRGKAGDGWVYTYTPA